MHLQFALITPQTSVTITCGIQPTGVVTMIMKMLYNTCNMCICDFPDMNALVPWACTPWAQTSGKSLMPMLQLLHKPIVRI